MANKQVVAGPHRTVITDAAVEDIKGRLPEFYEKAGQALQYTHAVAKDLVDLPGVDPAVETVVRTLAQIQYDVVRAALAERAERGDTHAAKVLTSTDLQGA